MDGAGAQPEFSNSTHHLVVLPSPIQDKWGYVVVFIVMTVNTMEWIIDLK